MRRWLRSIPFVTLAIAAGAVFAYVCWSLCAQAEAARERTPQYPLSIYDPAAIEDPAAHPGAKLVVPHGRYGAPTDARAALKTIVRDLETGATTVEDMPADFPLQTPFVDGRLGPAARMRESPEKMMAPFSVIGSDSRVRVTNVTAYPWRAVVKLWMKFGSDWYMGSGALIAPNWVLTAGHCTYDDDVWASSIEVIPGLYGSYKPYGSTWGAQMYVPALWVSDRLYAYDIALIRIKKSLGNYTGWFGYAYYSNIYGSTGNLSGYPGDLEDGYVQYFAFGKVKKSPDPGVLQYQIDCYSGQSGSSVYAYYSTSKARISFAVHSHHNSAETLNFGTFIDSGKFNWIKSRVGGH